MKKIYLLFLLLTTFLGAKAFDVTFSVDMNGTGLSDVSINGTFNGWCGYCSPMTDANADGIWEITIPLTAGSYEYKFTATSGGSWENLAPGSSCTVTNFGFTNRSLTVSADATLPTVCWQSCVSCNLAPPSYNVTFQVDMNNVTGFTTPTVNGSFDGWCGSCHPLTDANADGVWETTLSLPAGTYEYKFAYDNWAGQETLIAGTSCTVTNSGYTNRNVTVAADATLPAVCWGSCVACSVVPPTYTVTFQVNMQNQTGFTTPEVNGTFNSWCGNCNPLTDANADGIWETTLTLQAGTYEYKFSADGWGTQEELTAGSSCTVSNNGYTNRALNLNANTTLDVVCWGLCTNCAPPTYPVTFQVDMANQTGFATPEVNGTFNGWCGNCNPMTDANADGVWETTLDLPAGTYEYKFTADAWGSQENLTAGSSCTVTNSGYTNRALTVGAAAQTLPVVCWASCTTCAAPTYDVTFKVDMQNVTGFTTPEINGTFNGWCGNCTPMTDANADGVWEVTIALLPGTYEYKFSADGWGIQENLTAGSSCTVTNFGYTNRALTVGTTSEVLSTVCWNTCSACAVGTPGCTTSTAVNYNAAATIEDESCLYATQFNVDMNCAGTAFTNVYVTGPWCGWCGADTYNIMTDANADGIYTVSVNLPAGNVEYKYMVDNWASQENLVDDMQNGGSCAPVTDYANYANRQSPTGQVKNDVYGRCSACPVLGCTSATACNYNVLATEDDGSCQFIPSIPAVVNGEVYACEFLTGGTTTYSTPAVANTTYQWIAPAGMTIVSGQGTNTITVSFGSAFITSSLKVRAVTTCGASLYKLFQVKRAAPARPTALTSTATKACPGDVVVYTATAMAGATTYNWTAPTGATVTAGQGTNIATITFNSGFTASGIVSVTASNGCGVSLSKTKSISLNTIPLRPSIITGTRTVSQNQTAVPYSVVNVAGLTYNWTIASNFGTIASGQGSNAITVNASNIIGTGYTMSVTASNGCGTSPVRAIANLKIVAGVSALELAETPSTELEKTDVVSAANMTIFPNPASDFVTLQMENIEEGTVAQITIFDLTGKQVFNMQSTSNLQILNVSQFAKGMYVIHVNTTNQNFVQKLQVK